MYEIETHCALPNPLTTFEVPDRTIPLLKPDGKEYAVIEGHPEDLDDEWAVPARIPIKDEVEQHCVELAKRRSSETGEEIGNVQREDCNEMGFLAEGVVADALGQPLPEFEEGFDNGQDCLFDGRPVDIKSTEINSRTYPQFVLNYGELDPDKEVGQYGKFGRGSKYLHALFLTVFLEPPAEADAVYLLAGVRAKWFAKHANVEYDWPCAGCKRSNYLTDEGHCRWCRNQTGRGENVGRRYVKHIEDIPQKQLYTFDFLDRMKKM